MNRKHSEELYAVAQTLMPGGVSSPVRAFLSVGGTPLFAKKGKGAYLVDEDNNEYIDYCLSWGALIHGHADKDVVRAIEKTAQNGTSFGMPHRYEIELASIIKERYKTIDKIRFVNSGTEATMSAVRLARGYTGRNKFIKCEGCYHGHADHLLAAGGSGIATFSLPGSAGVTEDNIKNTIVIPYNDIAALEETLKMEGDNVAALIIEPVPCNYGLLKAGKQYLQAVRNLCKEYGVLLIFDEVINGFRLAPGGAQEYFEVEADLTTLGKIIGGGLPVGAYGGPDEIMNYIAPIGNVYQAGTLSGNPLAMIAGTTALQKLFDQDSYRDLKEKTAYLDSLFTGLKEWYQNRVFYTSLESIFYIAFTDKDSLNCSNDVKEIDVKLFARFHNSLLEKGIYFPPSGYEVCFLSTAHTKADLDKTAQAIYSTLEKIM